MLTEERGKREKFEHALAVSCPNKHCLYPHKGPSAYHKRKLGGKWGITACDNCYKNTLQKDKLYWRCLFDCDYDLCHKCVYALKDK